MSSNISLSYPNRIDECTVTSPSSWSAALPLANVQDRVLQKVARTNTGVKTALININLTAQARLIGCVALANHNLSTSATVQFRGYSGPIVDGSPTGVLRFDSTANYFAWPVIYAADRGLIPWENKNFWRGTVEEDQRKSYTHLAVYYAPSDQICKSVTIAITDTSNADNYLEIGRIFLGRTVEPEYNPDYGDISQGYIDLTEIQRAVGTKYFYVQPKMRTLDILLKNLNQTEALSGFYDAQREVGVSGELLYAFSKPEYISSANININMTTDKNFYARTFMANFAQLDPVTTAYFDGYSTAIKLEEII